MPSLVSVRAAAPEERNGHTVAIARRIPSGREGTQHVLDSFVETLPLDVNCVEVDMSA